MSMHSGGECARMPGPIRTRATWLKLISKPVHLSHHSNIVLQRRLDDALLLLRESCQHCKLVQLGSGQHQLRVIQNGMSRAERFQVIPFFPAVQTLIWFSWDHRVFELPLFFSLHSHPRSLLSQIPTLAQSAQH